MTMHVNRAGCGYSSHTDQIEIHYTGLQATLSTFQSAAASTVTSDIHIFMQALLAALMLVQA